MECGTFYPSVGISHSLFTPSDPRLAQVRPKECAEHLKPPKAVPVVSEEHAAQHVDVGGSAKLLHVGTKHQGSLLPHTEHGEGAHGLATPAVPAAWIPEVPKPYKCIGCGKRFRLKCLLQIHQRASTKITSFTGLQCRVGCSSSSCVSEHQGSPVQECTNSGRNYLQGKDCQDGKAGGKLPCCADCGKTFPKYLSLLQHLKVHETPKPQPCDQCMVLFMYQSDLMAHEESHLDETLYQRKACGDGCICQPSLDLHFAPHRDAGDKAKAHVCASCGSSFQRYLDLLEHSKVHEEPKPQSCTQCSVVFFYESDLARHEESHLDKALGQHVACGKDCMCELSLQLHFASDLRKSFGSCLFSSLDKPQMGEVLRTREKPYLCNLCGQRFQLEVNLEAHYRYRHKEWLQKQGVHSNASQTLAPLPEEVPGEWVSDRSVLEGGRRHVSQSSSRTSRSRYGCSDCGKGFSSLFSLHQHQQQQHQAWREGSSTSEPGKRARSMDCASGVRVTKKLHRCQECGKTFVYKWQLVTHLKDHAEAQSYSCPYCERTFGSEGSLREHCQTHVGDERCESNRRWENPRVCDAKLLYQCAECGKSLAKRYMADHQAFHAGVRYRCLLCERIFNFQSGGLAHLKQHGAPQGNLSSCPKCGTRTKAKHCTCYLEKIFIAPEGWQQQQQPGPEGRNGPAEAFLSESLDAKHQKSFSSNGFPDLKPRVCLGEMRSNADECGKRRRRRKARPKPYQNSYPKPFRCTDCGKNFAYLVYLVTHRRMHLGERPFQCGECGKGFMYKRALNLHWKIHM